MNTRLLLVGEAFGAEEEKQGKPFVGRSGQLLRGILEKAGIKDYTLTNVCMFRPLNNRLPNKKEILKELPRLGEEIKAHEHIVSLGNTAYDTIWSLVSDEYLEGKTFYHAYHPAYILRNMSQYEEYLYKFKELAKNLSQI